MPIKLNCPICGSMHYRKPSKEHLRCCSNECGQIQRSRNCIKKHKVDEYIELYIKQKLSLRKIAKIYNINPSTVSNILKNSGISLRTGSEAIKTQWIDADERRNKTSQLFKKLNFKHGQSDKYRKHVDSYSHRKWSKAIRKRDNYTCQECGLVNYSNHAHHIIGIITQPELAFELNNGTTLCRKCHLLRHN